MLSHSSLTLFITLSPLIIFSSLSLFFSLQVDKLVLGGGMVFTFLKARGVNVGNSLVEDDQVWKSVCLSVYLTVSILFFGFSCWPSYQSIENFRFFLPAFVKM